MSGHFYLAGGLKDCDPGLVRLAASDDLTAASREEFETFADAVVGDALRRLEAAAEPGDVATAEAGVGLFVGE